MIAVTVLLNIFCIYVCILYGAIKGLEWQMTWITLCFVAIFFLIFVDMLFEAAMICFVIPSQTIGSIRQVQMLLNQVFLSHSLSNILPK